MHDTAVYALLNSGGETIYIGMSVGPKHRLKAHRGNREWGSEVHSMKILQWLPHHEAEEAEHQAIFAAKPRYNKASVDGRRAYQMALDAPWPTYVCIDPSLAASSYTASEAAQQLGVTPGTLRRWEQEGYVLPARTLKGHRRYTREDIEALQKRPA